MIWKAKNFFAKMSTGILMEFRERENSFIKNDIPRNVNPSRGWFMALEPFVPTTITKENTSNRSEGKFLGIIWSQIWPARTAKNPERLIVWFLLEKMLRWGVKVYDFTRENID
jgi:hypothetical protein